jgi:hypothetical protein
MAKSERPAHAIRVTRKKKKSTNKRKKGRVGLTNERQTMTPARWDKFIAAVSNGAAYKAAAHAAGISSMTVDAYLISNVSAGGQYRDAQLIWNRREWPMDAIQDVLAEIALGKTVRQAFDTVGIDRARIGGLYRVFLQDKAIRKLYDEAREMQAESYADDIIDISDSTMKDRDENGKIDHEVINRDRLRVDSRKWLSGKWAPRRYGDNKHVDFGGSVDVNHAAVLTGGRKRIEKLHAKRKGATIENDSGRVVINE